METGVGGGVGGGEIIEIGLDGLDKNIISSISIDIFVNHNF